MYEERKSNCSARIAIALSMRNMKQSELCEKTNIPKSAMSQYISGAYEPKQDRIYTIAKALNVSEVWLMGYDVPMERTTHPTVDESADSVLDEILVDLLCDLTPDEVSKVVAFVQGLKANRS